MLAALSTIWSQTVQLAVVTAPYDPMAMYPTSPIKNKSCQRCASHGGRRLSLASAVQVLQAALGKVGTLKEIRSFIAISVGQNSSELTKQLAAARSGIVLRVPGVG